MSLEFIMTPVPNNEARDFIAAKPALTRDIFDGLLPELRALAFTVTGIDSADALREIRERISALPEGMNWDDVVDDVAAALEPWLGDGAPRRAELLTRIHGNMAYTAQRTRELDAQKDVLPYRMYVSIGDGKVRPSHKALHGLVFPSDSPFWDRHTPPWEWGCRCDVVGMTEFDAEELKQADAAKPETSRRVLEGATLQQAEGGRLVRSPTEAYDLRTPIEKGKPGAFEWSPREVRPDLANLRARYQGTPEGQASWQWFEGWAQKTKIPDTTATVWEWLEGAALQSAKPLPTVVAAPAIAPGAAKTLAQALKLAGIPTQTTKGAAMATEEQIARLRDALKKKTTLAAKDAIDDIDIVISLKGKTFAESKALAEEWTGEFLAYVPKSVAKKLPKLKIRFAKLSGAYGDYDPNKGSEGILRIDPGACISASKARETLFHELTHWLHFHHPDAKKRDAIRKAFAARVAGLRPDARGYFDDDFPGLGDNYYAGKTYKGKFKMPDGTLLEDTTTNPFGTEFTTRALQRLAKLDMEFLDYYNEISPKTGNLAWREQFLASLKLLFP